MQTSATMCAHVFARMHFFWRTFFAALALALVSACGGGDSNDSQPPAADSSAQGFKLLPQRLSLAIDDDGALLALGAGAKLTWSSSDPAVATVDANGRVKSLAKGTAVISASTGTSVATSTVRVYRTTGADPDPSTETLIVQALAQNKINAEQALTYRVFALFGDERLPTEFEGAPSVQPDHLLLREVSGRLGTLSPAAQSILRPFLLPPIYAESWFAHRIGTTAAPAKLAAGHAQRQEVTTVACSFASDQSPTGPTGLGIPRRTTEHFNIFAFKQDFIVGEDGIETTESYADFFASIVEEVYASETQLFNRYPMNDAKEDCNGGDGKVDVYLHPFMGRAKGITTAYPGRCEAVPAFILLGTDAMLSGLGIATGVPKSLSKREWRSYFAHEFLHVLQFGMDRNAACDDYKWFDEATATWVMDHVDATVDSESGDRSQPIYRRSGQWFANYLYNDHRVSIEKASPESNPELNGYGDYIFFQYMARKYKPESIAQMFDATIAMGSVEAMASVVEAKGGMKAIWPEFAASLWNDATNKVLDYWSTTDNYDFGLAAIYTPKAQAVLTASSTKLKPLKVDQKSGPDAIFNLLANALEPGGSSYEVQPRSMFFELLKFTDPSVHTVTFFNPIAGTPDNEFMKLQVVKKIGGVWKAPEDWTLAPLKTFCLDKKDERVEELLVIVSNSEVNLLTERPFQIAKDDPMRVTTSNVGCWQWQGTASLTTNTVFGYVTVESAAVTFDTARSSLLPDAGISLGYALFVPLRAGTATYSIDGPLDTPGCSINGTANAVIVGRLNGSVFEADGGLIANFGLPEPLYRVALGSGLTNIAAVTSTIRCPGSSETTTAPKDVHWLSLPAEGAKLSSDGQSITGRWDRVDSEGTKSSVWNFHAVREQ